VKTAIEMAGNSYTENSHGSEESIQGAGGKKGAQQIGDEERQGRGHDGGTKAPEERAQSGLILTAGVFAVEFQNVSKKTERSEKDAQQRCAKRIKGGDKSTSIVDITMNKAKGSEKSAAATINCSGAEPHKSRRL
jgi:hypothetical protein